MASRLAGLAGAGLSIGTIVTTSRQYGQALSDPQAITGATAAEIESAGSGCAGNGTHDRVQRQPNRRGAKADGVG